MPRFTPESILSQFGSWPMNLPIFWRLGVSHTWLLVSLFLRPTKHPKYYTLHFSLKKTSRTNRALQDQKIRKKTNQKRASLMMLILTHKMCLARNKKVFVLSMDQSPVTAKPITIPWSTLHQHPLKTTSTCTAQPTTMLMQTCLPQATTGLLSRYILLRTHTSMVTQTRILRTSTSFTTKAMSTDLTCHLLRSSLTQVTLLILIQITKLQTGWFHLSISHTK